MRKHKILGKTGLIDKQLGINKIILELAKQRKQTVYGARSIEKQANLFSRPTQDWDVFDKNPKKTSNILQKRLDKLVGFDAFFSKPAMHKGTWKVKGKGVDGKANTQDDVEIADYTKPTEKFKFIVRDGVRYRVLKEELKKKVSASKDPTQEFRHAKDKDDIKRIQGYLKIKNIIGGSV